VARKKRPLVTDALSDGHVVCGAARANKRRRGGLKNYLSHLGVGVYFFPDVVVAHWQSDLKEKEKQEGP